MRTALLLLILCVAPAAYANDGKASGQEAADAAKVASADDDNQVVCERAKKLGSNRAERVCTTVAQRRAAKEKAQSDLQRLGRCSGNDSMCSGSP